MKVKTPEELAAEETGVAKTLYLDKHNIKKLEAIKTKTGVSVSKLVNEAITHYLETIKSKK